MPFAMSLSLHPDRSETVSTDSGRLIDWMRSQSTCAIAFSGGVDSSVVAYAAFQALGAKAVALTGLGPAVSQEDIAVAKATAASIGIEHHLLPTDEIQDENYQRNDGRRCYFCKSNLYTRLTLWCRENGWETISSGTNWDDLGDYRPGIEAGKEFEVRTPLVELQLGKAAVRAIAMEWKLPVADRPASPCLASRIAYGESVTIEKLNKIEKAEAWLRNSGFEDVRVRLHNGNIARIEVQDTDFVLLSDQSKRKSMVEYFREIGFAFVTLDLAGRENGSLNRMLPIYESARNPR
jgi:pyridinium-3,5-biscarboxylic acid mononucleotide sulfurtransferase